jgi:hypothetical protein
VAHRNVRSMATVLHEIHRICRKYTWESRQYEEHNGMARQRASNQGTKSRSHRGPITGPSLHRQTHPERGEKKEGEVMTGTGSPGAQL